MNNNELQLNDIAEFTWDFGCNFFLETAKGNFVWSDPDCNGDNTIKRFNGSIHDFFGESYGRDKGQHFIEDKCGHQVKILDEEWVIK